MRKIPYINYDELDGFYMFQEVADMLRLDVQELIAKVEQHKIRVYQDNGGRYLLNSSEVKKLHFKLYHESRGRRV